MVHLTHYNRLLITRFTHPKKKNLKKVWSMWDPIERRRNRFMHLSMFLNLNLYPRRTKPPNYFFFYLIFLGNLLGDEENKRGQLFVWQVVFAPSKAEKRLISASIAKKRISFLAVLPNTPLCLGNISIQLHFLQFTIFVWLFFVLLFIWISFFYVCFLGKFWLRLYKLVYFVGM